MDSFSPKIKTRRLNPFTNAVSYFVTNLFPRYIFARFEADTLLRTICFTRGVHSVVSFGNGPVPIDDEIIDSIKSQVREDGCISIEGGFKPGDELMINNGPLKNLAGVFDYEIKDTNRIVILLTCVSYQNRIVVEREHVTKAQSVASA